MGGGTLRERGIQGSGGELRKRGIQGGGTNHGQQGQIAGSEGELQEKGILPYSDIIVFFVNITIKTSKILLQIREGASY